VIVGASAALVQGFLNRRTRSLRLHFLLGIGVAASAIARRFYLPVTNSKFSAEPYASPTCGFPDAILCDTFPVALASRGHQQARLGQYWKESYSWLVPYYLVSAAVASAANAAATSGVSLQTILLYCRRFTSLPILPCAEVEPGDAREDRRKHGRSPPAND